MPYSSSISLLFSPYVYMSYRTLFTQADIAAEKFISPNIKKVRFIFLKNLEKSSQVKLN